MGGGGWLMQVGTRPPHTPTLAATISRCSSSMQSFKKSSCFSLLLLTTQVSLHTAFDLGKLLTNLLASDVVLPCSLCSS